MKYLILFEDYNGENIFNQTDEVIYFMNIIKDKLLELQDKDFEVFVQDNKDLSILEKMIRITIRRKNNRLLFNFSDCKDSIVDILLTNKELKSFKKYHVVVTYNDNVNELKSLSLDYDFNSDIFYDRVRTPINDVSHIKYIEVFFE